jgi:hypothetical protein
VCCDAFQTIDVTKGELISSTLALDWWVTIYGVKDRYEVLN